MKEKRKGRVFFKLIFTKKTARASPIRFAAAVGGFQFEDVRLDRSEFAKQKQEGKFPNGSVPVLHVGEKLIAQSNNILR